MVDFGRFVLKLSADNRNEGVFLKAVLIPLYQYRRFSIIEKEPLEAVCSLGNVFECLVSWNKGIVSSDVARYC